MAGRVDDLSNSMAAVVVGDGDDHFKELGLAGATWAKLRQIERNYENVFSWDVRRLSDFRSNLMVDQIDFIREKYEWNIACYETDAFDLKRFCLKLILSYELYTQKSYEESLLEMKSLVTYLESCTFDDSNKPHSESYNHIARATYCYISLALNRDSDEILKNVKPVNNLNQTEKAAICGVKALFFMEYPPKGNDIALKIIEEARILDSSEFQWLNIWLGAKGRVRRFYDKFKIPGEDEIHAADILCTTSNARCLLKAAGLYINIAKNVEPINEDKYKKYFKLSSDIILKAIELSGDNLKELCCCLVEMNKCPIEFHSDKTMKNIAKKLANVENGQVYLALGKYFSKHEKDHEKAKIYFSRGLAVGNFACALDLIRSQCIQLSVDAFPFVNQLKMIYDVFPSPKRRLIILSQIILFYFYYEDNPKELMHYLKLYMDQEIDVKIKKQHLISCVPIFKIAVHFQRNKFFNNLLMEVKYLIKHPQWTEEEKSIINDTYYRCYMMSRLNLNENQFSDVQTVFNKTYDNRYNKNQYNNGNKDNWRKQRDIHKN